MNDEEAAKTWGEQCTSPTRARLAESSFIEGCRHKEAQTQGLVDENKWLDRMVRRAEILFVDHKNSYGWLMDYDEKYGRPRKIEEK